MFMRKITHKKQSISRVFAAIALAVSLSACELPTTIRKGPEYDITAPADESSSFYLQKAINEPTAQADWYLLAVKAYINEGKVNEAANLILRISKLALTDVQHAEWQLNRAELLRLRENPQAAIDGLKFETSWQLPSTQWARYFNLQHQLYTQVKDVSNAFISLINLENFIAPGAEQELSDNIWTTLVKMPAADLQNLANLQTEKITNWINFVSRIRKVPTPLQKQEALDNWIKTNPNMFMSRFLPNALRNLSDLEINKPNNIAVILPLSEKFSLQGNTIRNGFMQALINDKTRKEKPAVYFYDSNTKTIDEIITDMRDKGVQFVIGPLQKSKVEAFITSTQGEFRNIAMNIPNNEMLDTGSCFFTLSPEQEAEQAASRISKKHRSPVVIAPKNELGKRVSTAFSEQWLGLKGKNIDAELFSNNTDMQRAIERALGLAASQSRIYQLSNLLELDMISEPRSRRDVDAIYLVADASELTLLKPFVEVAINPGVKVPKIYASSRSNNLHRKMKSVDEIVGIEFSDVPLLVNPNSAEANKFHKLWPDMSNNMVRLYSLGMDAYALIEEIPQLQVASDYGYKGESGTLYLEDNCTIRRVLPWAVFSSTGIKSIE